MISCILGVEDRNNTNAFWSGKFVFMVSFTFGWLVNPDDSNDEDKRTKINLKDNLEEKYPTK